MMFGRRDKNKDTQKLASELFAKRMAEPQVSTTHSDSDEQPGSILPNQVHPRKPITRNEVITRIDDVPSYREVLTTEDGLIPLPDTAYGSVALIQSNDESVGVLLYIDDGKGRAARRTVRIRSSQNGIQITKQIITTPEVLSHIYNSVGAIATTPDLNAVANDEMEKLMDDVLRAAVKVGASDVHIEVSDKQTMIRHRVHGDLMVQRPLNRSDGMTLCRAIWVFCDAESRQGEAAFDEKKFLDHSLEREINGEHVRIRYAQRPAMGGLDITMRIIMMDQEPKSLFELGYDGPAITAIERMLNKPNGLVLFSGVTGSGKSTSLQSCLTDVWKRYRGKKKVITIENPIEYPIPGARQTPVTDDQGFTKALKSAMRSDPDILQLSEIRDEITAKTTQRMVQTGHLVFSTVHATNPMTTIGRLMDLGVERNVIAEDQFIVGIITQKLLKTLCPSCRIPYKKAAGEGLIDLKLRQRITVVANDVLEKVFIRSNDPDCPDCSGGGSNGRTLCCEILVPNRYILEYIQEGNITAAGAYWKTQMGSDPLAGRTLLDHAIIKMRRGEVCPIDVESDLDYLDSQESKAEIKDWYNNFEENRKVVTN